MAEMRTLELTDGRRIRARAEHVARFPGATDVTDVEPEPKAVKRTPNKATKPESDKSEDDE